MAGHDEITLFPLTGWSTATIPGQCCMVRLDYVTNSMQNLEDSLSLPLAMTAVQARDLADVLLRAANAAETRDDRGSSTH